MRLGSVEVLAAVALFVGVAGRVTPKNVVSDARDQQRVRLEVNDRGARQIVEGYCPFTIGRASGANLVLTDPDISRVHARLDEESDAVFLSDHNSSNGTYLNGERIAEGIELRSGDVIEVGVVKITYLGKRE